MTDDDLIRRGDALAVVREWTYCCDAEDAIAALPAVKVGVKPLVWLGGNSGDYSIRPDYGQGMKPYMVTRGSRIIGWCDTESEAEVIADKDNKARILAALDTPAQPALAAALAVLDSMEIEAAIDEGDGDFCRGYLVALGDAKRALAALRQIGGE